MAVELKVPEMGESVVEVELGDWLKQEGDYAEQDEPLVVIESDKVTVELPAPVAGVVKKILRGKGAVVKVGEVIGEMEPAEKPEGARPSAAPAASAGGAEVPAATAAPTAATATAAGPAAPPPPAGPDAAARVMPAAQRLLHEHGLEPGAVTPTGPGGRLLKEDVQRVIERGGPAAEAPPAEAPPAEAPPPRGPEPRGEPGRAEEVVPMSRLRRRIAERLVAAQQQAALLTTFNEIDMTEVIALRREYKARFQERYGIKLGFMSFFVKAAVDALRQVPQLNAEIRDTSIVYRNYYDIGVAVGGGKGLVVPVLRSAERMSFAEIERAIADFARRAQTGELTVDELSGGTFTISNGGVYGSLLSTPIVNPPQSGILGLHAIQERPVAREGEVVVRPMMYVALTYDHRIVDGREAVTFLKRVKEAIEQPARMLLEI